MYDSVRIIICRDLMVYDDIVVKLHGVVKYKDCKDWPLSPFDVLARFDELCACKFKEPVRISRKGLSSYLVSAYSSMLLKSFVYRKSAMKVLKHFRQECDRPFDIGHKQTILIRLRAPKKQFLDYRWSEKLMQMVIERQEADHAMSWLSTLGGAFSALGEEFEHCAKMAGKISVKQFELAMRLDNPLLVARCELYAALSFIQRGYFATPKSMIQKIYKFALKEKDVRLQNMCQGVWAKLRYNYKQYRQQKKSLLLKILHVS